MTYSELVEFCGDERKAYFLSSKIDYREMSEADLTDAIANLMVKVAERTQHRRQLRLEYIGGRRRDTLRG